MTVAPVEMRVAVRHRRRNALETPFGESAFAENDLGARTAPRYLGASAARGKGRRIR